MSGSSSKSQHISDNDNKAKVKVHNVSFYYARSMALDDVSVSVKKGDFLAVLGPNGSGKSTLLRTISGALRPTTGSVLIDEREVSQIGHRVRAQSVAVLGQSEHTDFPFTAQEVVLLGRYCRMGQFQRESDLDLEIVKSAMELTGCESLASRPINSLSGGERQKVLIARALAQEPEVLLLDEPTTFLDISSQASVLGVLRRLNEENGVTVIAVFHDLNLAVGYARTMLMLDAGRIHAYGPPEVVLTAENIRAVYKTPAIIQSHPTLGLPYVLFDPAGTKPLTQATPEYPDPGPGLHVHVIGGGGAADSLLRALDSLRFEVTAGILNVGDSDWSTARSLGIDIIDAPPFSPVTEKASILEHTILESDFTVLAEVPFGFGNLTNLEALLNASRLGAEIGLIGYEDTLPDRDYTQGVAASLYKELIAQGSLLFCDVDEALTYLRSLKVTKRP
jgi:iron complex transport system ATP-binding protein